MLYIVEVVIAGDLAGELSQMRTWLDHMKFQAIDFRKTPGADTCRVGFASEQEARRFAQAFGGQALHRYVEYPRSETEPGCAQII